MVVAMTAAVVAGSATLANAESGALIYGGRLAYNYSTLAYGGSTSNYTTYGGHGFEAGLLGRFAVVEGQMGLHAGANFIYRTPYSYDYLLSSFSATDMAVSVPVLFEINPFVLGGLNSSVYEMIFVQVGLQADFVVAYSEDHGSITVTDPNLQFFEREKFNIGLVVGAVGYFNSHVSFDIRYYYAFTCFDKTNAKNWYPYSISAGLSFYL
jgi:hypothetical protein